MAVYLAGEAHSMGNISFHPHDISNRLNKKWYTAVSPHKQIDLKNMVSSSADDAKKKNRWAATNINTQKKHGSRVASSITTKYSGGDGQKAAIPDKQTN